MLIVFGVEDPFGTEWATVQSQTFGTPPTLFDGSGHFPWFEQPAAFYDSVKPFLAANVGP